MQAGQPARLGACSPQQSILLRKATVTLWRALEEGRELGPRGVLHGRGLVVAGESRLAEVSAAREPGGYGGVALQIVDAMVNARPRGDDPEHRPTAPACRSWTRQAVVEVPCLVGPGGVVPVAVGDVPMEAKGLILQVRASERAAIDAALSGSRREALRSLALHPLVSSVEVAERILDGYLTEHPALAGRFT